MKIGCVLLAAGSGKRYGGDKLSHTIDGVSLAERACKLHANMDYAARVLVCRPADTYLQLLAKQYGFAAAVNEHASRGIGTSAAAGAAMLLALHPYVDGALFAVCDQPYLTAATVLALLTRFAGAPDRIIAPVCQGKRGNPVVFPRMLLPEFASLDGDTGGGAIIRAHPDLLTTVKAENPVEFIDIDTKSDELRNPYADNTQR